MTIKSLFLTFIWSFLVFSHTNAGASEDERPRHSSLFENLSDQLERQFQEALETLGEDRERIERIFGEDVMGRFHEQMEEMAKQMGVSLTRELPYSWEVYEDSSSLFIHASIDELKDLDIKIEDHKLTLKTKISTEALLNSDQSEKRQIEQNSKEKVYRLIEQDFVIPEHLDYSNPEFEKDPSFIKITFYKKKVE